MENWIGSAFYCKISPSEIKSMSFSDLKYWNNWHEIITQAEINANTPPK